MDAIPAVKVAGRRDRARRRALTMGLGTLVLLLAAALRLWALAELPPGLHHDEAFHLLSARAIVEGAGVPVYITGNQGNEPMFAYLASAAMRLLGAAPWAGRVVSAGVGIIAVALTFRLGQTLFPGRWVGVWAGLALASLYWHVTMSRWGSQPMLSAAAAAGTMLGLWHGARSGRWRGFVLAGASLSFGLWSYVAFRVFPLVPLVGGLALLIARRSWGRRLVQGGLLAAGVGLVLYAPLGYYFIRNPEWFFNRYSQITALEPGGSGVAEQLAEHAEQVAASLVWPGAGDQDWRQNYPGRPAFDPIQALLFGVGGVMALRRWRKPEAWALGAWVIMGLAPAVLTEFPPQYGRTVMVTPALALLVGLGIDGLWRERRWWLRAGLAVALAGSAAMTAYDYFVRWANDDHLFVAFDSGLVQLAVDLSDTGPDTALYETPVHRDYPTLEYTLGPEAFSHFRAFNGRACTVLPARTEWPTAFGVIVGEDQRTLPALMAAYPNGDLHTQVDSAGQNYAAVYEIPAGQVAGIGVGEAGAEFAETLRLRDYRLENPQVRGGEALQVTLTWEMAQATPAQLTYYVHVLGAPRPDGSTVYAQRDSGPCDNAYPTWQWQPDELLREYISVPLPGDMPVGAYDIAVGWYDALTQQRLPVTGGDGAGSFRIGAITVEAR